MSESNPPYASPERDTYAGRIFVRAVIGLTVILALGMVSLIFYRSQSVTEPTAVAVVIGDASLDGARITISSNGREIVRAKLSDDNRYSTPVMLEPGVYTLVVGKGDEVLLTRNFAVEQMSSATFDLPTCLTVLGSSADAGAEVSLRSPYQAGSTVVLSQENHYAAHFFRAPGAYHLTVVHNGRPLREEMVSVKAHQPRRLKLNGGEDGEAEGGRGQSEGD